MKKSTIFLLLFFTTIIVQAQVGINTTIPNAQLDIRSTNQATPSNTDGILIPKVDAFPATNPTAAQQGMLVYLTTTSGTDLPGFYYWDNATSDWISLATSNKSWSTNGNAGMNSATNFIGTTDDTDLIFKRNNFTVGMIGNGNFSFGFNNFTSGITGNSNYLFGSACLENNVSGSGNNAFGVWALNKNTTGNYNVAMGYSSFNRNTTGGGNVGVGESSGYYNTTGTGNTSIGRLASYNSSTGNFNTSVGNFALNTNSTGNYNTVIGTNSDVAALNLENATAIGAHAEVGASNSLVLGSINGINGATSSVNVGVGTSTPLDRLHVVGSIRMVDGNQAVGRILTSNANGTASWANPIGTTNGTLDQAYDFGGSGNGKTITADAGAITIEGTDGLVVSGTVGSGALAPTGAGDRMIWNPRKGAFRAGNAAGDEWDDANLGLYSAAFGANPTASGTYSFAIGIGNTASGVGSFSAGLNALASGDKSTTFGYETVASGEGAVAFGNNTDSTGYYSTAFGSGTTASGIYSTAFGLGTTASGYYSTTFGLNSTAIGQASVSFGEQTYTEGDCSASFGRQSSAHGMVAFSAGQYTGANTAYSAAFGYWSSTGGECAFVAGRNSGAGGEVSTCFGENNSTSANNAFAAGRFNTASGTNSTIFGHNNNAISFGETVLGIGATNYTTSINGNTQFRTANATDRLFVIGNAIDSNNSGLVDVSERSDALIILKNGLTRLPSTTNAMITAADGKAVVTKEYLQSTNWSLTGNSLTNPATNFFGTSDNQPLAIRTNNIERMRVTNAGDVGLGTVSPAANFEVRKTDPILRLAADDFNSSSLQLYEMTAGLPYGYMFEYDGNLDKLHLWSKGFAGNDGIRMTWLKDGNVGIGTTTPLTRLDVVDVNTITSNLVYGNLHVRSNNAQNIDIGGAITLGGYNDDTMVQPRVFGSVEGRKSNATTNSSSGYLIFKTNNAGNLAERLRITNTGSVGVGIPNPLGLFELALDQGRKPGTNTWTIVSDQRLKNINGNYTKGLNEILQLNPIRFNYKNVGERTFDKKVLETEFAGFIAQEVQPLFPDAVGTDDDGFLNFNIHPILIASINAIKELNANNQSLQDENEQLKQQLEILLLQQKNQESINKTIAERLAALESKN